MTSLNELIGTDSGWTLSVAYDINDLGQIVGLGYYNGQPRAFLMSPQQTTDPVPEPATLILLGSGVAAGMAAIGIKKRRSAGQSITR